MFGPLIPVPKPRKGPSLERWQELTPEELEQEIIKSNGTCNLALRLDHYASIDPDSLEARKIVDSWDLPRTIAWRTASGAIRRLFKAPTGLKRMQIPELKLDLRHGNQFCDVIPPSFVIDKSKGLRGSYEWLPDCSPEDIEAAELPSLVVSFFYKHLKTSSTYDCKSDAKIYLLEEGNRDEGLYHIAYTLFKGGASYQETEYIIKHLAMSCDPPFPQKDASRKVESAYKKYQEGRSGNLTAEVREWVSVNPGEFSVSQGYLDLGCVNVREKATFRQAIKGLVEAGEIIAIEGKKGRYRPVMNEMSRIKLSDKISENEIILKYPFHLERYYRTMPKTCAIVCGEPDAGKTAWMLNFIYKNLYSAPMDIHLFTSEMGQAEIFDRASSFSGFNAEEWDKRVHIWEREGNFEDGIFPNAINLIDFMEIHEEHWLIGKMIKGVWNKLKKGIAIIALQQDPAKSNPKGGLSAREKPRLAITLKSGKKDKSNMMVIDKIKNWRNRLENPRGIEIEFKLINGCTFRTPEGESL
jgi:hypothetical protein